MANTLIQITNFLFDLCFYVLLANIIMSWLVSFGIASPNNPNVRSTIMLLDRLTEPVLGPIRRIVPTFNGVDFSPVILLLLLRYLQPVVVQAIWTVFQGA